MLMNFRRPAPLTPPDCDLRAYDWFPFWHKRLLQSAFWSRASDQACRISVDLWSKAYQQVPAASVPNDDFVLAEWAGLGRRNTDGWRSIKSEVMQPWILCSDDRWYHPTLSEVACNAWVERRNALWKRECDRIRKENGKRKKSGLDVLDFPPKPPENPFLSVDGVVWFDGLREFSGGKLILSGGSHDLSCRIPGRSSGNGLDSEADRRSSAGHPLKIHRKIV